MTDTTFQSKQTVIATTWCQDVNDAVYRKHRIVDTGFTITQTQAAYKFSALLKPTDAAATNGVQVLMQCGAVTHTTFAPTLNSDGVGISSWVVRGGASAKFVEAANFGVLLENNTTSAWAVEIDVNNEGASGTIGDGTRGIGLAFGTGSTYSPDTAIWIYRATGEGTGPGFQRGIWIQGARQEGVKVEALNSSLITTTPAAPNTITAFAASIAGDTYSRWTVSEAGVTEWGPGGSTQTDLLMSRNSAGALQISSDLHSNNNTTGLYLLSAKSTNGQAVSRISAYGKNSSSAYKEYAAVVTSIVTNTASSEVGAIALWTMQGGSTNAALSASYGVWVGSATSGDMGAGTLNVASGLYSNGVKVVGNRVTNYAAMTGTPNTNNVYDTASVTLPQLAGRVAALQASLTTHGLIGP